jgi:hypothetical protein
MRGGRSAGPLSRVSDGESDRQDAATNTVASFGNSDGVALFGQAQIGGETRRSRSDDDDARRFHCF